MDVHESGVSQTIISFRTAEARVGDRLRGFGLPERPILQFTRIARTEIAYVLECVSLGMAAEKFRSPGPLFKIANGELKLLIIDDSYLHRDQSGRWICA